MGDDDLCCLMAGFLLTWTVAVTGYTRLQAMGLPRAERLALWGAIVLAVGMDLVVLDAWTLGYAHAECSPCATPEDVAREQVELAAIAAATIVSTALAVWSAARTARRLRRLDASASRGWRAARHALPVPLGVFLGTTPGWLTTLLYVSG